MKNRILSRTADGSCTFLIPDVDVTYHSRHGALQESGHVFIESGFRCVMNGNEGRNELRIFEMGFGTGLNCYLTAKEAARYPCRVYYHALEAYPLQQEELSEYLKEFDDEMTKIHDAEWNKTVEVFPNFSLHKQQISLLDFSFLKPFHLVYYDAFAPSFQPELWTETVFQKIFGGLHANGMLVTYCSKGDVRRALESVGFLVEKLAGPKGKREILRARRPGVENDKRA